jgi:hypothetical protein
LTTGNQLIKAELNLTPAVLQVTALRPLFQMNLLDEPRRYLTFPPTARGF